MEENSDVLSVRTRKRIFGGFAWAFVAVAVLRFSYGDVLSTLFFGTFATIAFALRRITGKWWAEL